MFAAVIELPLHAARIHRATGLARSHADSGSVAPGRALLDRERLLRTAPGESEEKSRTLVRTCRRCYRGTADNAWTCFRATRSRDTGFTARLTETLAHFESVSHEMTAPERGGRAASLSGLRTRLEFRVGARRRHALGLREGPGGAGPGRGSLGGTERFDTRSVGSAGAASESPIDQACGSPPEAPWTSGISEARHRRTRLTSTFGYPPR